MPSKISKVTLQPDGPALLTIDGRVVELTDDDNAETIEVDATDLKMALAGGFLAAMCEGKPEAEAKP